MAPHTYGENLGAGWNSAVKWTKLRGPQGPISAARGSSRAAPVAHPVFGRGTVQVSGKHKVTGILGPNEFRKFPVTVTDRSPCSVSGEGSSCIVGVSGAQKE